MGRDLWAETRVPVFEQVLAARFEAAGHLPSQRDNFFGYAYVENSALEIFTRNRDHLAVVLPELFDDARHLPHLSLHNGTIWRWVRPRPLLRQQTPSHPAPRIPRHPLRPHHPRHERPKPPSSPGAVHGLAEKLAGISGGVLEKKAPLRRHPPKTSTTAPNKAWTAQVKWLDGQNPPRRPTHTQQTAATRQNRPKKTGHRPTRHRRRPGPHPPTGNQRPNRRRLATRPHATQRRRLPRRRQNDRRLLPSPTTKHPRPTPGAPNQFGKVTNSSALVG